MVGIRDEAKVRYRAVADFADLIKKARTAKAAIAELKKEEQAYNAAAKDADKTTKKQSEAFRGKAKTTLAAAKATRQNSKAVQEKSESLRDNIKATELSQKTVEKSEKVESELTKTVRKAAGELSNKNETLKRTSRSVDKNSASMREFSTTVGVASQRLGKFDKWLDKLRSFRPRLIPPFIALIPIIGALLAVINPLVAALGAIGAAGFGLASSLGLALGSAVAIVPAIAALVGAVSALLLAFNGVGDAISAGLSGDMEALDAAMKKLTPSARGFVKEVVKIAPAWKKVQQAVQESFFAAFTGDMTRLSKVAPAMSAALSGIASSLGKVASKALIMVSSGPWTSDFVTMGESSAKVVGYLGDGLLFLMDAFRSATVAAGPFLERLTSGFKEGAANFARLVDEGRKTGSLAAYLDRAGDSLAQWWRIAKNITATIVNYASAAREFNQWMTDGFEGLSKSWKRSSQEAKKEGSPYKQYLTEIKPLLDETRGLFGDFFRWFKKQAMDSGNISAMTQLVSLIRTELGPALGHILETLSDSGIGDALVKALGSIVSAIDAFLSHGGSEGFKIFWEHTVGIFEFFSSVLKALPVGVVQSLATLLATIAAIKFFGIWDLGKGLGVLLGKAGALKAFTGIIAAMSLQFGNLQRTSAMKGAGGMFSTITNGAKTAGGGLAALGRNLVSFAFGPVGIVIGVLTILFGVFSLIADSQAKAKEEAEAYESSVESLTDSLDGLGNATKSTVDVMADELHGAFKKIQDDADGSWLASDKFDRSIIDYMKEVGLSADGMALALQKGGAASANIRKKLENGIEAGRTYRMDTVYRGNAEGGISSSREQVTTGYSDQAKAYQKVLAAFNEEDAKLQEAKRNYTALVKIQREYRASLTDTERSNQDFNAALAIMADEASNATDRVGALKTAMDILLGGTLTVAEAEANLVRGIQALASSLEGVSPAIVGMDGSFDKAAEGGLSLHDSLMDVRDGMYESMDAAAQAKKAQGDFAGAQLDAKLAGDEWVNSLRDQLTQMGFMPAQIDGLIKQYGLVPATVSTVMMLEGASTAEQQLLAIKTQTDAMPTDTPIDITTGPLTKETLDTLKKTGLTVTEIPGSKNVQITGVITQAFRDAMTEATKPRFVDIKFNAGTSGGSTRTVFANGGMMEKVAHGARVRKYANGGNEDGTQPGMYRGRPGGIIKFAEQETNWEAYISGKTGQESRNRKIAADAVQRLGGFASFSNGVNGLAGGLDTLRKAGKGFQFANGGSIDYGKVGVTGHGTQSSSSPSQSANSGTIIENLVINNPTPEPASDSLPRTIRKVAYLGA